jgi:hypothetical protein
MEEKQNTSEKPRLDTSAEAKIIGGFIVTILKVLLEFNQIRYGGRKQF